MDGLPYGFREKESPLLIEQEVALLNIVFQLMLLVESDI